MNIKQERGSLNKDKPLSGIQLNSQKMRKLRPIDKNKIKKRSMLFRQKGKEEGNHSGKHPNHFQKIGRNNAFSQSPPPLPLTTENRE